jgi:hypothetical protein
MALLTWISVVFLILAAAGSIAVAGSRGLRAWRTFRRFSSTTSSAIGDVLAAAAEAERRADAVTDATEKLSAALAQLNKSRAELAVIEAAAAEAKSLLAFRGAVPRK